MLTVMGPDGTGPCVLGVKSLYQVQILSLSDVGFSVVLNVLRNCEIT